MALIAVEHELSDELIKNPTKVVDAFASAKRRLDLQL